MNIYRLKVNFLICFVVLALCACATMSPIPVDAVKKKRVVVSSVAASNIHQKNAGFTVFGNESATHRVVDWALDTDLGERLTTAIRAAGVPASHILISASELPQITDPNTVAGVGFDLKGSWSGSREAFKLIGKKTGAQILVLLAPSQSGDYMQMTNQILRGLGAYTRTFNGKATFGVVHAFMQVVMIDLTDGVVLNFSPLTNAPPTAVGAALQRGQPTILVDPELYRIPFASLTVDQMSEVKSKFSAAVGNTDIRRTVERLFAP